MKLVPNYSYKDTSGKAILKYPRIAEAISFVNGILRDKPSFLAVFTLVADQFVDKEKFPGHTIDRDLLYERSLAVGDIDLQVLFRDTERVTAEYFVGTAGECFVKSKIVTVAARYIQVEVRPNTYKVNTIFLLLILLHGCCHQLTPEFLHVSTPVSGERDAAAEKCEEVVSAEIGKADGLIEVREKSPAAAEKKASHKIPPKVGKMILPGRTTSSADCGFGLEYAFFGPGCTITVHGLNMTQLYALSIIDLKLPAEGKNLRRFHIPYAIVSSSYDDIMSWHKAKDACCFCCYGQRTVFPVAALRAFAVSELPADAEIDSDTKVSRALHFPGEAKLKCYMDVNERTTTGGGKLSPVELHIRGDVPSREGSKR
jgi:hypothetical protein